ncbi:hypothetical protein ABFS83_03G123000 [Erythranthe nasuta]
MEEIEKLSHLSDSLPFLSELLAGEDVDETPSRFLNVIALGDTGAGKSAVLNSLIGHPVLPTGEGGATHAPTYVDLIRDRSLGSKTIINPPCLLSRCPCSLRRLIQTKWSKNSGQNILKLITSTAPPLKLADLPGVDNVILGHSLRQYAEGSDAVLLVVIPADQAPNVLSAQAIQIAKEFDAEGTRTVGVITKIDEASSKPYVLAAVKDLLLGNGPTSISNIPWVAMIECLTMDEYHGTLEMKVDWEKEFISLKRILEDVPISKIGRFALVEALAQNIRLRMKHRLLRDFSVGTPPLREDETETQSSSLETGTRSSSLLTMVVGVLVFILLGGGVGWYIGYETSTRYLLTGLVGYGLSFLKEVHSAGIMLKDLSKLKSTFWDKKKN